MTSTAPAESAGVVAASESPPGSTTTSVAGTPPTDTVVPAPNPLPVTVTLVPPAVGPLSGSTEETVGTGS